MTCVSFILIYGFGEHQQPPVTHGINFVKYGMFSRDQLPVVMNEYRLLMPGICLLKQKETMNNKNDFL